MSRLYSLPHQRKHGVNKRNHAYKHQANDKTDLSFGNYGTLFENFECKYFPRVLFAHYKTIKIAKKGYKR